MKKLMLFWAVLLPFGLWSCDKTEISPKSKTLPIDSVVTPDSFQPDLYKPYIGQWQGVRVELVGRSLVANDTVIDLYLKRPTPSDLRTYGTIRKAPNYSESTSFDYGTLLWDINFDVIPNQLVITEIGDGRLWRFYDIIQMEQDTLILQNQERYEFWCRY